MILIDFILNCDQYIGDFIVNYGNFVYLILFSIIFCETGLVFLPFLPGDSLIFAAGTFAGMGDLNVFVLFILVIGAAIIGDTVNYEIGKHLGRKIIDKGKWIKQEHLDKADALIAKYGSAAVLIARFMPIVRTIVPFVVGMGRLQYKKFITFNAIGGVIWGSLFICLGYFFGNIPFVADHFSLIMIAIILISVSPIAIAYINNFIKKRKGN